MMRHPANLGDPTRALGTGGGVQAVLAFILLFWQFLRSMTSAVRDPHIRPLLIWLAMLLGGGTVFYHHIEGWGWLDSLYFCIIALATVGFGDFTPHTTLGKIFTIVYMVMGIGVLLAVINATVERAARRAERQVAEKIAPISPITSDTVS